jgi:hypothetical protein
MRRMLLVIPALLLGCTSSAPAARGRDAGPVDAAPPTDAPRPAADAAAPAAGPMPKQGMHFAWQAPCRVPVTEHVFKNDKDVDLSYDIVFSAGEKGGYELTIDKIRLLRVGGRDASSPTVQRLFAGVLAQLTFPTLVIDKDGGFVRAKDMDKLVEQMLGLFPGDQREQVRAVMSAPEMVTLLEQQAGEIWATWVSVWLGWDVPVGKPRDLLVPIEAIGKVYKVKTRLEHLGETPGASGLMRLRATQVLDGKALVSVIGSFLDAMVANLKDGDKVPKDLFKSGERTTVYQVDTDPASLRPWRASKTMDLFLEFSTSATANKHEARATEFDWQHATGCGL